MKVFLIAAMLLASSVAFAQQPMGQSTPTVTDLDQQLQEVGCRAERQTAAQTIVTLRGQIDVLQKQLNAKNDPPPKSGATKH